MMEYVKKEAGGDQGASNTRNAPAGRDSDPQVLRLLRTGFRIMDKAAPWLGGYWAYWLWFRTHRFPEPRRELEYRSAAQIIPMEYNGKPLAVYSWGEGPAVLLTHGWNGRATQLWGFIDPLVRAGFRVVAFDLPAHGRSAGNSTDLFKIAESMQQVSNEFDSMHGVIAHSLSTAALVMALRDGLETNKVVCISPPSQSLLMLKNYVEALELSPSIQARLQKHFLSEYGVDVWEKTSAVRNVGVLATPALVIHDKDDREVPWQEGESIAKNWPDAELLLTESLGHRRILRNRDVVTRTVEFLKS
jgi:pimeloyl-ACP methyl ester carboxylesterase